MSLYDEIRAGKERIAVVGLGYVGLPIAMAFSKKFSVIGYDINKSKIELYKSGIDPTGEIGDSAVSNSSIFFSSDEEDLRNVKFIVIAVPTPVTSSNIPDLSLIVSASEIVGRNLSIGSVVVYESTVYPGCTEDVCIPILEKNSGLKCRKEFSVGYSPERINPGDKNHPLENIVKIVSGIDSDALNEIQKVYGDVIEAGTYAVSNIKTAEAIKVVENSQRDINIAFMNELAMVFDRMDIDTNEVVDGMNTKWNALGFRPGLVGGHCIGVDPYYFTFEAERLGYHSQIILNGRKINDEMGAYVADIAIKKLLEAGFILTESKIAILGLTFKENCKDIRNSKVFDIYTKLREYGTEPLVVDPWADVSEVNSVYGISVYDINDVKDVNCIIIAVAHNEFKKIGLDRIKELFEYGSNDRKILLDVKGIFKKGELAESGLNYWRL